MTALPAGVGTRRDDDPGSSANARAGWLEGIFA